MKWTVRLAKQAAKQLEKAPRDYHALLLKKLREIAEDPFRGDVVPLQGKEWKSYYRKRVERYRIIFRPHQSEHIVDVVAILARDDVSVSVAIPNTEIGTGRQLQLLHPMSDVRHPLPWGERSAMPVVSRDIHISC